MCQVWVVGEYCFYDLQCGYVLEDFVVVGVVQEGELGCDFGVVVGELCFVVDVGKFVYIVMYVLVVEFII